MGARVAIGVQIVSTVAFRVDVTEGGPWENCDVNLEVIHINYKNCKNSKAVTEPDGDLDFQVYSMIKSGLRTRMARELILAWLETSCEQSLLNGTLHLGIAKPATFEIISKKNGSERCPTLWDLKGYHDQCFHVIACHSSNMCETSPIGRP